jgi:hypothetical protein
MVSLGWDDIIGNAILPGVYSGVKGAAGGYDEGKSGLDWIGDLGEDYMNSGKNRYQTQTYTMETPNWGGYQGAAGDWSQIGLDRMGQSTGGQNWAQGQAQANRGPQAQENQQLSNLEAQSRGWDQAGALQLAREGAMGLAPSQAAYQMQAGLDRSLANQQAIAGGARGGAGIAMASANANASAANLQNQAYTAGGQLAAQEQQAYRQMYGDMANQQRAQDQNRLGMGNQMSQYNAGLNDQYRLGMGGLANQYGQTGLGWYNAAQSPYDKQAQLDQQTGMANLDSQNQSQAIKAGVSQANAQQRAGQADRLWSLAGTATGIAGSAIPRPGSGIGGK